MDPQAQFVTIDGEKYCYRMQGSGPPVLLLHGITDSSRFFWRQFFSFFSSKYSVVAFDLRGHGCSEKPKRGYTTIDQINLILKFMDYLGLGEVVLLGHSLGGIIGTKLALLFPDRVSKLIIYDSPLAGNAYKTILWIMSLPIGGSLSIGLTLIPYVGRYLYNLRTPATVRLAVERLGLFCDPSNISEELIEEKMKCSYDAFYQSFWNVVIGDNIEKDLQRIAMPTLIICGAKDPFVSQKQAKQIKAMIPNSKLVTIENTGHFPLIEKPDEFNQNVSGFLNDSVK